MGTVQEQLDRTVTAINKIIPSKAEGQKIRRELERVARTEEAQASATVVGETTPEVET